MMVPAGPGAPVAARAGRAGATASALGRPSLQQSTRTTTPLGGGTITLAAAAAAAASRRCRRRPAIAVASAATPGNSNNPHHPRPPAPAAFSSATAAEPVPAEATPLLRKSYPLRGGHQVAVTVLRGPAGEQIVRLRTDVPAAAPLLHWGVEGGRDYKGGWRLPGGGARPPGTRQYKDRALQTPFVAAGGGGGGDDGGDQGGVSSSLTLVLAGDEASDALNFVVKDDATDTWWDHNGANFRVPLRVELATASMLDGGSGGSGQKGGDDGATAAAVSAAAAAAIAAASSPSPSPSPPRSSSAMDDESDLPQLSEQLCDTWAWVRWDHAGRPQRSARLADDDYSRAVGEMTALLRAGRPLEELWRVARGETPYAAYKVDVIDKTLGPGASAGAPAVSAPAVAPRPADGSRVEGPPVSIPEELVAVQAYILWEQAGKPQGADFGAAARKEIEARLRRGETLAQVDASLRGGGGGGEADEQRDRRRREEEQRQRAALEEGERRERERRELQQQQQQKEQQQQQQEQPPSPPLPAPAPVSLGESRGLAAVRDPLALIKPKSPAPGAAAAAALSAAAPSLSEDKHRKPDRPLDPVVQAAALDPSTRWRRTFALGGTKAQLLAVVKQRRPSSSSSSKTEEEDGDMVVTLITDAPDDVVLHWGASPQGAARKWTRPPRAIRPEGTVETATGEACETPFLSCGRPGDKEGEGGCVVMYDTIDEEDDAEAARRNGSSNNGSNGGGDGARTDDGGNETLGRAFLRASSRVPLQRLAVRVPASAGLCGLTFVLRSGDGTRWFNDAGGGNFFVPLPFRHAAGAVAAPDDAALAAAAAGLRTGLERAIVDAEVNSSMWTLMHRYNRASELLEAALDGGIDITAPALAAAAADGNGNGNGNNGANAADSGPLTGETAVAQACADIYVWLRYSATRQLTWQRNYNTQPRILSAAQERLTRACAAAHARTHGEAQEWCRLMLTTVGRGGDGQRIRDEILHIMHRNHIPEVKGTWMEEWHQKLHNNTTPDDVPICQAYLAFLEADGDRNAYWRVLSDAGVTRERLESFERPVRCEPEWFGPEKKDALVRDFRAYLGVLKAVHSGADLQASAAAVAGDALPEKARPHLGYVLSHIGDSQVLPFVEAAVEARAELAAADGGRRLAADRDLLYLDLALEGAVRAAAERGVGGGGGGGGGAAAALMAPLLQNLALTLGDNEEVAYCLKAWQALPAGVRLGGGARASRDEALLAVSVAGRVRRAVAAASDAVVARVSRFATSLGRAAGCDDWAVDVFAEEVVRGGPLFAVSLALSAVEPGLRAAAELGAWQVISPGDATGRVVAVPGGLSEVQDLIYDEPTILVVGEVTGEEEVPEGAVAVLTPDAPDVLSHVAVRARNLRVLFATCHDAAPLEELTKAAGTRLRVKTTAAGAVTWSSVGEEGAAAKQGAASDGASSSSSSSDGRAPRLSIGKAPEWCGKWALTMDEFRDGTVGAKSKNLAAMRSLASPPDVGLPPAVTVPFGAFEKALEEPANAEVAAELRAAVARVRALEEARHSSKGGGHVSAGGGSSSSGWASSTTSGASDTEGPDATPTSALPSVPAALARCRALAERVSVPPALRNELAAALSASQIPVPESEERWQLAENALKAVWASKYTDRAFLSLRRRGIDFDRDVRMAVCVMRVVPARYAFVLHTTNPSTGDKNEIFGELVKGLGEALVSGAVPGSSLAFAARKPGAAKEGGDGGAAAAAGTLADPAVLSYPSKSVGMFVRESLIFRSDSNGEDLEGYAGAGLYESVTMDKADYVTVDYSSDPLTADRDFRKKMLSAVAGAGYALEKDLGGAQDVEGVVDPEGKVWIVQTRPQV